MVLIPTMALAAPARGVSFQEQPDPFIPEHAVDLVRQASQFYFRNFIVQNPSVYPEENLGHHLSEEDKAKVKGSLDWAMRVQEPLGSVAGLRSVLADYYAPRVIDAFIESHLNHFPELQGLVVYNDMIFTSYGDTGANLFLELHWDNARLEILEQKETPEGPVIISRYTLPGVDRFEAENENGEFHYQEVPREFTEIVEFLWCKDKWKLNTFIHTFEM